MTSNSSGSTRVGTQSQPRTSSSSVLWAHLQRKDTANPATSTIPLPPLAPLDKTNTSLRILLHDTQSHFETFADKVNVLTKGVDEAKREIGLTKTLFEKEHEVLSNEMFGLANRCQTEILKTMGEPAQASRLADLQIAVQLRLEGLDKRVDSMQMVVYPVH
ncbi:hypothetical protein CPB85DRAFT_1243173 [Mucidula mucida]|nr:hypothetical protein CPB85DRAFT_1243173 [Mucidula mucida]